MFSLFISLIFAPQLFTASFKHHKGLLSKSVFNSLSRRIISCETEHLNVTLGDEPQSDKTLDSQCEAVRKPGHTLYLNPDILDKILRDCDLSFIFIADIS